MAKRYLVRLSEAERTELEALVKTGRAAARKRLHAQILLKADEGEHGPAWTDTTILKALYSDGGATAPVPGGRGVRDRLNRSPAGALQKSETGRGTGSTFNRRGV